MLHQDLARALTVEGNMTGEHLIENHARGIDVDLLAVVAGGNLRRYVMYGPNALRLGAALTAADEFREAVIAHLHHAVLEEDVRRLQVAVDDAVVMQVADRAGHIKEPLPRKIDGQTAGVAI